VLYLPGKPALINLTKGTSHDANRLRPGDLKTSFSNFVERFKNIDIEN